MSEPARPTQKLRDWLSQQWVRASGRRIDPQDASWLAGPVGEVGSVGFDHIHRLASSESLTVHRLRTGAGLTDTASRFGLDQSRVGLSPRVAAFYERTADHELEVWSEWNSAFAPLGRLLRRLYSRRLQQLNLPHRPLETAKGMESEIIQLREAGGALRYTFWHRILKSTGQVVYSGAYSWCTLPDGRTCVKVVFPLPRGSATFIMSIDVDECGGLILRSRGQRFGDPGFYFLLRDSRERVWARYVESFREELHVYEDDGGILRADHGVTLWGRPVLRLHYKITPIPS